AVGVFILVNLAGEVIRPPFSTLSDWITLPGPRWAQHALVLAAAVVLIAHGLARLPRVARRGGALLLALGTLCAVMDTVRFYAALPGGYSRPPAVTPASTLVAAVLVAFAASLVLERGQRPPWTRRRAIVAGLTAISVAIALPLLRMM